MTDYIAELHPIKDARASFYGKAHIIEKPEGRYLQSYETIVAFIPNDGTPVCYGTYSATTCRHISEFLYQFAGMNAGISEIRKMIPEGNRTTKLYGR